MPIKINLLTEAFAEEELRRHDPVKQALYAVVGVVVLVLIWFSSAWVKYQVGLSTLTGIEGQIQLRTNAYALVQADFKNIGEAKSRLEAVNHLSAKRFLDGNLLNALQKIYVPHVRLIRLKLEQSYELREGTSPRTNSFGIVPGRPATAVGRSFLTLDARDSSPNPGDQVNRFKDAVAASDFFTSNFVKTNAIRLSNLSAPQSTGTGKPFVLFTLDCQLTDKTP